MEEFWITQSVYLLRMSGAVISGFLIGYERESSLKMAGVRTHVIVALTAALMMLISKYGFQDVLGIPGYRLDPSRIAAGVVTAVGFLGASVIFTHEMNISGLTTAAGMWATVGIGMAFGTGMYVVGIATTMIVLSLQFIFHRNFKLFQTTKVEQIILSVKDTEEVDRILERLFMEKKIKIANIHAERTEDDRLQLKLYVKFPAGYQLNDVMHFLDEMPEIVSIDI